MTFQVPIGLGVCVLVGSVPELTVNFSRLKGVSPGYIEVLRQGSLNIKKLIVN